MRKALRQEEAETRKARKALSTSIEALTAKLTRLRADNAKQQRRVPEAEHLRSMTEQTRSIARRELQIATWLRSQGVALPQASTAGVSDAGSSPPPADVMVARALTHIRAHGQLRRMSGQAYFGADGVATTGDVLRVARVGAVVIDEDRFHPLELALDGSLRVSRRSPLEVRSHGELQDVNVVLFDPDNIRPSPADEPGWHAWFDEDSEVMWAIAALGVLAALLFVERLATFAVYLVRVFQAERRGPQAAVSQDDPLLAAVALVQCGECDTDALEEQAVEAIVQAQPVVKRGVSFLGVVATVTPLLGLLGTVSGMIATFAVINDHGTGDPKLLSGGISEALLSTQFGLSVAIPALLMQTLLYRAADVILRRAEKLALRALRFRSMQQTVSGDQIVTLDGNAP